MRGEGRGRMGSHEISRQKDTHEELLLAGYVTKITEGPYLRFVLFVSMSVCQCVYVCALVYGCHKHVCINFYTLNYIRERASWKKSENVRAKKIENFCVCVRVFVRESSKP